MAMDSRKSRRKSNPTISPILSLTQDNLSTLDIDESGDPILGVRGGTQIGDIGVSGNINSQGQGSIGIGNQTGGVGLNAGINQSGAANIGASTNIGGDTSVGVGINSGGQVGASIGDPSIIKSGDVTVGGSVGVGSGGVGVTPTVQIGDSKSASTGGQIGGAIGTAAGAYFGGPVGAGIGSALGSAIGSGIGGLTSSKHSEETDKRKQVINAYKKAGLFDGDKTITYPDGSVWNFDSDAGQGQTHDWKDPSKAQGKIGERPLFNYEIDYTNDLDYVAGMAGISLSRLFAGDKNKQIDQTGNALGNSFLGKVGYGKD